MELTFLHPTQHTTTSNTVESNIMPSFGYHDARCRTISLVCTWSDGGHVGVLNNSEKVFWEFNCFIMQNPSDN